jgi:hypothetical protein
MHIDLPIITDCLFLLYSTHLHTRISTILYTADAGKAKNIITEHMGHTGPSMANTYIPDAQRKIDSREKDVPWYTDSIGTRLGPAARKLLEEYSHIPPEQVESHIFAVVGSQHFNSQPYLSFH